MTQEVIFLIGRVIFGLYFLISGFNHIKYLKMISGYAGSKKIPLPKLSTFISGLFLLAGGLSIIFWKYQTIGSILAISFLLPAALFIHNFWKMPKKQRQGEMINFMRNWALIGALLIIIGM